VEVGEDSGTWLGRAVLIGVGLRVGYEVRLAVGKGWGVSVESLITAGAKTGWQAARDRTSTIRDRRNHMQ
jgi:hypothetical protein